MAARYSVGEVCRLVSPISSASCFLVMGRSSPVMREKAAPTPPAATEAAPRLRVRAGRGLLAWRGAVGVRAQRGNREPAAVRPPPGAGGGEKRDRLGQQAARVGGLFLRHAGAEVLDQLPQLGAQ